jgi:hypothetical protein
MSHLTPALRRALTILTHVPAYVIGPGTKLGRLDIAYVTAERLVILEYARPLPREPEHPPHGALVITRAGRAALAQPTEEIPIYLHERDGLTTRRGRAAAGEPEVIDTATINGYWREQALLRELAAADKDTTARRMRDQAKAA